MAAGRGGAFPMQRRRGWQWSTAVREGAVVMGWREMPRPEVAIGAAIAIDRCARGAVGMGRVARDGGGACRGEAFPMQRRRGWQWSTAVRECAVVTGLEGNASPLRWRSYRALQSRLTNTSSTSPWKTCSQLPDAVSKTETADSFSVSTVRTPYLSSTSRHCGLTVATCR